MTRNLQVKQLRCLACVIEGIEPQCGPTESHHLNLDGKAGQKRLGDEYTVALGTWHHRGEPPRGMTASEATYHYGPSLARSSRLFRQTYGDDRALLERTNALLERL